MRILIIGAGGREHALAKALQRSKEPVRLYAVGTNAGMQSCCTMADIPLSDHQAIRDHAKVLGIDFCVVGPDEPLVHGLVDVLEAQGIPCFGPSKAASRLEGSKSFAKAFMQRHHIPTPAYRVFDSLEEAREHVRSCQLPVVIKADGLALGKGVVIAFARADAVDAVERMMGDRIFGESGAVLVIEEYVSGPEVSLLVCTDGTHAVPLVSAMDHKRAWDGDEGPNTGGMGVVAPNPYYTQEVAQYCMTHIVEPTINGMREEGHPFTGCLFFGLMLCPSSPVVIEYNCRFGDPEAEAVLALLDSDLLEIMLAVRKGRLDQVPIRFKDAFACSVTVASKGYPLSYRVGKPISFDPLPPGVEVLHAGTKTETGTVVTHGGRVLHIVGTATTLEAAITLAYQGVGCVHFAGMEYRKDIGKRALEAEV
ncbi:phosphoribosylamine--glycine ligase [Sphaerochaeta sp.]|jgi:phosphoribosylamine--glycine ligase|uniref:phosphoribosylamine--glycine ligase n=1 Tax=Sphaerochaeta sp. TaxID=1972642 RepID=UPI002FCA7368